MLPVANDEAHVSLAHRPGMNPEIPEPQHRYIWSTPSMEHHGTAHQCLETTIVDVIEDAAQTPIRLLPVPVAAPDRTAIWPLLVINMAAISSENPPIKSSNSSSACWGWAGPESQPSAAAGPENPSPLCWNETAEGKNLHAVTAGHISVGIAFASPSPLSLPAPQTEVAAAAKW